MLCAKTNTQLLLDEWVDNLSPQLKSQPQNETDVLAADLKRLKRSQYMKGYYEKHPEKRHQYYESYMANHGDELYAKRHTDKGRAKISASNRKHRLKYPEDRALRNHQWYIEHKHTPEYRENARKLSRKWYWNNREKELIRHRKYDQNNRDKINTRFHRLRRTNIQFALKDRLRASINRALRRNWVRKSKRTMEMVGCSVDELKAHLESQFVNGMTWKNRSTWHVDHYVPIVAFDLTDLEEQKWAFNWRNLRPLPGHENHTKADTLPDPLPDWLPVDIQQRIKERTI